MVFAVLDYKFESGLKLKQYDVSSLSNNTVVYKDGQIDCSGGKFSEFIEDEKLFLSYRLISETTNGVVFHVLVGDEDLNDLKKFIIDVCTKATKKHINMCLDSLMSIQEDIYETAEV